jgi:hypothetical protein
LPGYFPDGQSFGQGDRAGHPRATYREAPAAVLDYRGWHALELLQVRSQITARLVGLANHEKHSPANPLSERDSRKNFY